MSKQLYCESNACSNTAVAKVYWPGSKSIKMCQECVDRARVIARSMDTRLTAEPLPGFVKINLAKFNLMKH